MSSKPSKNVLCDAVRRLREAVGDSQMGFAQRMGWHLVTQARYETRRPPKGKPLAALQQLAKEHGQQELWEVFRTALREDLGLDDYSADKASILVPQANVDAHLALEEIIGARVKDPKSRQILELMKPYTERWKKTRKWAQGVSE